MLYFSKVHSHEGSITGTGMYSAKFRSEEKQYYTEHDTETILILENSSLFLPSDLQSESTHGDVVGSVCSVDTLPSANTNNCYTELVINTRSVYGMHQYGWNEGNIYFFLTAKHELYTF